MENHVIDNYVNVLIDLNNETKLEIIERLVKSLKQNVVKDDNRFLSAFGGFGSDETAEDIIDEIKSIGEYEKRIIN